MHVGLCLGINVTVLVSVEPASVHGILQGALVTVLQQQPRLKQLLIFWVTSTL